jgi:hypothetical protein
MVRERDSVEIAVHQYEEHVLFGLNHIYYSVLKCTTCYHYTNIVKSGLINLIKIGNVFTTEKGLAYEKRRS